MHPRLLSCLLAPLALVAGLPAGAQTIGRQVTGTVMGTTDSGPLPGLPVLLRAPQTGATPDVRGRFSLSVPAGTDAVLVFSAVGYEPQEVRAGSRNSLDAVRLKESATDLNDVVAGYGTQRKRDITGALRPPRRAEGRAGVVSNAAQFVTGSMICVDGGFSSFGGV